MDSIEEFKTENEVIRDFIKNNEVMMFSKTTCPFCTKIKELFNSLHVEFTVFELDKQENMRELQNALLAISGQKTVPNIFIREQHIGGCDDTLKLHNEGKLIELISNKRYEFDLIVIGGGSGGLAASKQASDLGRKVSSTFVNCRLDIDNRAVLRHLSSYE